MSRRIASGTPEPLGVTPAGSGVNAAIFSAHATKIELCLFDAAGSSELERIPLPERTGAVHHGFIADVPQGTRYGLRAYGPYDPSVGHRFNQYKLLVDPHATVLDRRFAMHPALFAYTAPDGTGFSTDDSAKHVPKAIVAEELQVSPLARPQVPWPSTILYELNIRGFSMRNPRIPIALRGTFAGLADPASIEHFTQLGVTSIEIMPAAAWIDERHLPPLGLINAWGYNPVAFCAPDPKLAPGGWSEIVAAVEALHAAGIEVIIDVVLNHTGEGDALGPTVSLRGLDNASYYRLLPGDPSRYIDDMGTGNCLALDRPPVLRLAMDALRTWARAGVDGFRFDLATALGRRPHGFDPSAPLIAAIAQDPQLRGLKLIAEPWDIGPGGYQVGQFPADWAEWNDRFRDDVRRFWRGDSGRIGDMATRLAGSRDLFGAKFRPSRSINFIAAHDGFTLADLVSHTDKRNEANGEHNRDGTDANHSWNGGIEGKTERPGILAARRRDQTALLATLLMSRGTPMLAMGSEAGHSQGGNNNAYAQDNEISWLDWGNLDEAINVATRSLIAVRKALPLLQADRFLDGTQVGREGFVDACWLRPDGQIMATGDWANGDTLVLVLTGAEEAAAGTQRLAIILHRGYDVASIQLPASRAGTGWQRRVDTTLPPEQWPATLPDRTVPVQPRSVLVFAEPPPPSSAGRRTGAPDQLVEQLADAAGIYRDWWDHAGGNHRVSLDTKRSLLTAMDFDVSSAHLVRDGLKRIADIRAKAAKPLTGAGFIAAGPDRAFGVSAQLYALRRRGDQGIGDFTTLAQAGISAARAGASALGINPLHALFPRDRDRASPYHPGDRRFLDPLAIDITALTTVTGIPPDLTTEESAQASALSSLPVVDHTAAAALKKSVLKRNFDQFRAALTAGQSQAAGRAFKAFIEQGGDALRLHATFHAIAERQPLADWRTWPQDLQDVHSAAVRNAARQDADAVAFAAFEQWIADTQLGVAAQSMKSAGLSFGLYRDLAVGCAPDGAEIWANRKAYTRGVSIGAPPDPFSASGQNWNLPPPSPVEIEASGGALFRALITANMRHAGLLRIDHVLGLNRLFWIPEGATAGEGAYVAYPLELQLGVLAEESRRNHCAVVGEDLGTVPDGFREALAARNILSYRVLWFERDGAAYIPPERWPAMAVACASTHDLPTLEGWWAGADIDEREALDMLSTTAATAERHQRAADRATLVAALGRPPGDVDARMDDSLAAAIHGYVARTSSRLVLAQMEDLAGERVAVNLPGTDRERPNWRRKVGSPIENLFETPRARAILAALANR